MIIFNVDVVPSLYVKVNIVVSLPSKANVSILWLNTISNELPVLVHLFKESLLPLFLTILVITFLKSFDSKWSVFLFNVVLISPFDVHSNSEFVEAVVVIHP